MANRYWVGGTANWDSTAGTKWSDTSGGSGGFSVPTTADDVFFSAASTGTVTIAAGNAGAKSINCTGFTGTLTGTAALTVAGSITLVAGMTYLYSGTLTLAGTGTLTSAAKTFGAITISGSGITVTLGDALTTTGTFIVSTGTFTTDNYNFTGTVFNSNNSNNRTINLGSSTITLSSNLGLTTTTNLTFNAGTSQINSTGTGNQSYSATNLTFYNVAFLNVTAGNTVSWGGSSTFNDLSVTVNGAGLTQLSSSDNLTINGTLSFSGTSVFNRGFIRSSAVGTAITLTVNTLTTSDCDFRDITIAGTAAGTAPTRAGNCGGNSGITFPAAKNAYRVGTDTTWIGSSSWALSSGDTGADNNFPLPQDTAVIDEGTALTGTLSLAAYNISGLNCANRTTGITLSHGTAVTRYGAYVLGSGVTVSGTSAQTFDIRSTPATFTSAGKTITFPVAIVSVITGGLSLGDAFTSSSTITLTSGTFDANNYNLTAFSFNASNTNTKTITMGSGLWTLSGTGTGGSAVWTVNVTGLTFNKGTANILLSDTSTSARSFTVSTTTPLSLNKLTIGGATGTSTLNLTGVSLTELASTKTVAHTISFGTQIGTIDTWSVKGTSGNVVTVNSTTAGTRRTFSLTNETAQDIDYLAVKDIGINEANRFYVGANSTDNGNNANVYFIANPNILVLVTNVSGTGEVGTVVVLGDAVCIVSGESATGDIGTVSFVTDQILSITGVVGQNTLGTAIVLSDQILLVTGTFCDGELGNAVVSFSSITVVEGVVGYGTIGQALVWGVIPTPQNPNWTQITA